VAGFGLFSTGSAFLRNAKPKNPTTKTAPAIISQCGNSIDESKPIYFPFSASPEPDQIHSVILLPQSKPDHKEKRRDDTDEHPRVAGPLKAFHFDFAF
jgi:hypothetical protein